ncbi:serine hydrolase domain-containing protein [Marinicella meishanensis]|uniref:serine hydrolase domain-containing protein n=1 Tax=Marinicella meishanensis TaxID=2873263 RepID=UPI001CBE70C6|nr:serine hydrolase domain-containing protein [Marinicella sp. NBU2979]
MKLIIKFLIISLFSEYSKSCPVEFEQQIFDTYQSLNLPGISVVVLKNNLLWCDVSHGYANLERKELMTSDHVFWVASVTKPMTAYMMLLSQVDLHKLLSSFVHQLPKGFRDDITLYHLLTQTSEGERPGQYFHYGNRFNELVSVWGGVEPFGDALQSKLFAALGVEAYTRLKDVPEDKRVTPYTWDKGIGRNKEQPDALWKQAYPATNVMISMMQLAHLGQHMNTCTGLDQEQCQRLHESVVLNDGHSSPYGLGQFVDHISDLDVYWQYGFGLAESALLVRVPEEGLSIAIASNSQALSDASISGSGNLFRRQLGPFIVNSLIKGVEVERFKTEVRVNEYIRQQRMGDSLKQGVSEKELLMFFLAFDHTTVDLPIIWLLTQQKSCLLDELANDFLVIWYKQNSVNPTAIELSAEISNRRCQK